jgi:hypothetical protein
MAASDVEHLRQVGFYLYLLAVMQGVQEAERDCDVGEFCHLDEPETAASPDSISITASAPRTLAHARKMSQKVARKFPTYILGITELLERKAVRIVPAGNLWWSGMDRIRRQYQPILWRGKSTTAVGPALNLALAFNAACVL